jgi:DNA-binding GntR family transcriptional regulator
MKSSSDATAGALEQLQTSRLTRVDRSSTAERVADILRQLIIEGDLAPGTQLREHELVGFLDVSRNTLREAFRLLSRERLVTYHLHRGVAVREVDASDVRDLYRTRAPIELMAIDYSAHAPRGALEELLTLVEEAEEAAAEDDWKRVATLNIVFHQRLVELIQSERITTFFRTIDAELRLAFAAVKHAPDFFRPFIPRNRAIAELLLAGDRPAAVAELKEYLAEAEILIQAGLRNVGPDRSDGP